MARSDRSNRFFCSPEFKRNQPRRSVCAGQQLQLVDRLVSRNSPPVSCLLWLLPFMNRASFLALRCVAPGLQGLRHFDKRINYLHSDLSRCSSTADFTLLMPMFERDLFIMSRAKSIPPAANLGTSSPKDAESGA